MNHPDFDRARLYALNRLERELSPALTYHSLVHTRDDVVVAAARLGPLEGIVGEDLMLLLTAAYYHDIGFVEQRVNHEDAGARIAAAALPQFGYSPEQITVVCGMIMATKLPQTPHNLLEQVIADADLDSLGREDFYVRNQALRDELAAFGQVFSDIEWYRGQVRFLGPHRYWTESQRRLRDARKLQYLDSFQQLLSAIDETAAP